MRVLSSVVVVDKVTAEVGHRPRPLRPYPKSIKVRSGNVGGPLHRVLQKMR